jgi:hypothetical protein
LSELGELERLRQRRSNLNSRQHAARFENHRRHLTQLLASEGGRSPGSPRYRAAGGRLCVLGAGNCQDLDLERLATSYDALHLVDLDEQALERARDGLPAAVRARLVTHGQTDLSGLLDQFERWRAFALSPAELMRHPDRIAAGLAQRLAGPFQVVVSACVLSQMQLAVRSALSDQHPFFDAACFTLTLTHLRTLARLTQPGGRSLLVTDVATEEMAPLRLAEPGTDLHELLAQLLRSGDVFRAVHPDRIAAIAADDPSSREELSPPWVADTWLWHNGPSRVFLVCALEFRRLGTAAPRVGER